MLTSELQKTVISDKFDLAGGTWQKVVIFTHGITRNDHSGTAEY